MTKNLFAIDHTDYRNLRISFQNNHDRRDVTACNEGAIFKSLFYV